MTLKQFLKPDWRKIAVTVIIFLIELYILSNPHLSGFPPEPGIPKSGISNESSYSNYIIGVVYRIFQLIIIPIVIFYLLSCLIVWIYDKLRKKK